MPTKTKKRSSGSKSEKRAPTPRERLKNWPSKGYDGPQPWDHAALGVDTSGLGPGEPNDVSPIVVAHAKPVLSSGSGGPDVAELGQRLGQLGYPSSLIRGENPFSILDASVAAAVESFRREYGVLEDASGFPQGTDPANIVGPWTWEALLRATAED